MHKAIRKRHLQQQQSLGMHTGYQYMLYRALVAKYGLTATVSTGLDIIQCACTRQSCLYCCNPHKNCQCAGLELVYFVGTLDHQIIEAQACRSMVKIYGLHIAQALVHCMAK